MKTRYFIFQYFTMHFVQSVLYNHGSIVTLKTTISYYVPHTQISPIVPGMSFLDVDLFLNPGSTMLHVVLVVVILFSWSKSFPAILPLQPLFFLMTLKSSGQLLCRIFHILKLFDDIFMVSSILSTFYKLWVKSRYLIKIRLCILDKFLSLMSNLLTFPYMFCAFCILLKKSLIKIFCYIPKV